MKGPNERGREDSKNAIFDDLETQNFRSNPPAPPPSPLKFIKLPTYALEAQHYQIFFWSFRYGSEKCF